MLQGRIVTLVARVIIVNHFPQASLRPFSRSEMARVVMEKNRYKQSLFDLQEAMRHSQTLR